MNERANRPTAVTVLIALLLVGTLSVTGYLLFRGTQVSALLATMPAPADVPDGRIVFEPFHGNYAVISTRPIFYSTRAFYSPPPVIVQDIRVPPPSYRLAGTLVIPAKPRVALLTEEKTSLTRKVKEGDDLDGWRVELVEPTRVVVMLGIERFDILGAKPAQSRGLTVRPMTAHPPAVAATGIKVLNGSSGKPSPAQGSWPSSLVSRPQVYRPPARR